ncbi:MAG: SDR family oxidoreductase [Brevibacterium aurantiacum]|uniref:NAD(P)-dependent oxidoreductase n=1 Tax=Brevibacterium aurantiacum TaxID=273384 RepID=A0A2A3X2R6_BREAU|nr:MULTISPECIES: SDR family oxidoreductase [Brevibacterium]MDN5549706.1 SDR family oxidoreductase [Brevibacterium sp.]AZL07194.1 NAD(P)-dependent oxidoreductase [Brevibacterium aurantiacum]AZL10801.1 NAD(P)-dependent oxidoreductase [Brevibacterium aurantiacum]AZL14413.1 NAD(P)-dependent oxidoreductase [Brevibacterium aurantiacum]AZT94990.1 NAD(P)-dependent oxidoreductase [Brevibacterium aurantiacum]
MTQTQDSTQKVAIVTGASSGIGAATAAALAQDGWQVIVAARRKDKIEKVAADIGGTAVELDVSSDESVANLAAQVDRVDLLVNNAGGARGLDPVAEADLEDWQWMFDVNVLGTVRVTKALLDKLIASEGHIINTVSMAAFTPYAGGAGYNVAKFGEGALTRVLRLEHVGDPIRVTQIDPGRVETDFSLNRFDGDADKAAKVYAGKLNLSADDVAESIRWAASLPSHVNIDHIHIMPRDQA